MPSKNKKRGNPPVLLRMPPDTLAAVTQAVKETNSRRFDSERTLQGWILAAIAEKLAHRERSKKSGAKRRAVPFALAPVEHQAGDVEQLADVAAIAEPVEVPTL